MPANYPDNVATPRVVVNRPEAVYDVTDLEHFYAEDYNGLADEVIATQSILGLNPQGLFTTVGDRIAALEEGGGGISLSDVYPIGSVYISVSGTNPTDYFGGTWVSFAVGKCLVGIDPNDTDFDTVEETRGEKTHVLTTNEMPVHTHTQNSHNHTQNAHQHLHCVSGTRSSSGSSLYAPAGDSWNVHNTAPTTATNQAATAVNNNAGGDAAHNNIQPSIVVYIWKRTA